MPVAPNPLLTVNAPKASPVGPDKAPSGASRSGSGFDAVMAKQSGRDRAGMTSKPHDQPGSSGKAVQSQRPTAADTGKAAPAHDAERDDVAQSSTTDEPARPSLDASLVAGQVSDSPAGAQLIQAQAETVAPVLQAAQPSLPIAAGGVGDVSDVDPAFDPEADPLAGLPALRLALEHSTPGKGGGATTSSRTGDDQTVESRDARAGAVNSLSLMPLEGEGEAQAGPGGDKRFGALLEAGLKADSGTRHDAPVDDFSSRLASLSQAVAGKPVHAVPPSNPLQQPLAMNQAAWSEGLVNRVMYLSSQNLKSADIQLEPAELGRLDIRVNLANDQAAQVTFISGHAGVREALDGQVHRLRELFTQQGLAQPDVNVADQSRGQQQQNQDSEQSGARMSGVAARRAEQAQGAESTASAVAGPQIVIGDSAVDYYA